MNFRTRHKQQQFRVAEMSQDVQGVDMVWIQVYLSQAKELPLLSLASEVPTFARSEILCSGQGKKTGSFQSEPQPVIRGWNKSDSVQYLCIYSTRMYVYVCFLNFVFSADCPLHCTPSLGKKKGRRVTSLRLSCIRKLLAGGWVGGWVGVGVCVCACAYVHERVASWYQLGWVQLAWS